jgi:hypothetical protein
LDRPSSSPPISATRAGQGAIKGSDAVVNLVGVLKGDFEGLHVDGARNIAEACAEQGVGSAGPHLRNRRGSGQLEP